MTENEKHTIINALRVAAEIYKEDAAKMSACLQPRLVDQFKRQEREARDLADRIENDEVLS